MRFWKGVACGNDFVLLRGPLRADPQELARRMCDRRQGVGADGLIVLEPAEGYHFRWRFFNADGSRAEMCGNGGRCAALLAYRLGMAPRRVRFLTEAGPVEAEVGEGGQVSIDLPLPELRAEGLQLEGFSFDWVLAGVPHAVALVEDLELDVEGMGRRVRHHPRFRPEGTNVDFARVLDRRRLAVRTYERGVEAETPACGTGALASAYAAWRRALVEPTLEVRTRGGELLGVELGPRRARLRGEARVVFEGRWMG